MIKQIKDIIASRMPTPEDTGNLLKDLKGFVIVVTGASRGIGKATAQILRQEGANLALISRNLTDLQQAFSDFDSQSTLLLQGDVSRIEDVSDMTDKILDKFGKIDVLINNAGIFIGKPLEQTSPEEFESLISTNLRGVFLMSRQVIPAMKKQKQGFILNVGSKISHNTNICPHRTIYATTKYAIEGFSSALNKELKTFNIKVTCLMPGTVRTFFSLKGKQLLSPYEVAMLINILIKFKNVSFEGVVFTSKNQNL